MVRSKQQSTFWQTIGLVAFIGSSSVLSRLLYLQGGHQATSPMLGTVIATTSIMLTGFALFGVGRIFKASYYGYRKFESTIWKYAGMIMVFCGIAAMALQNAPAVDQFIRYTPSYDNLLIGVAGTSILSAGIGSLMVDRLMQIFQHSLRSN